MTVHLSRKTNEKHHVSTRISLVLLFLLASCSPATSAPTATVTSVEPTATGAPETPEVTELPTHSEPTLAPPTIALPTIPAGHSADEPVYPYFLNLAMKPDPINASQTKDGVTASIDWVYVDEVRVYVGFTVTGLDWPDGTQWDAMKLRISSTAIPDNAYSGAGGWNATAAAAGMITGEANVMLRAGTLNAEKTPNINVRIDLPLEGPTSSVSFRFEYPVLVLDGMLLDNLDQTVEANNVSMTLNSLLVQPSYVEAQLCFEMPAPVDWGLTASRLTLDGREYTFSGAGLIEGPNGESFLLDDPQRCASIGFDVVYDGTAPSVTLSVPKLLASVPEVVDQARVAAANERLSAYGIEIDYVNVDHGGNINVLKRPEGATDGQIYPLIWDALAEQYEGPWVFTVDLPK